MTDDPPAWIGTMVRTLYDSWQHTHGIMPEECRTQMEAILIASFISLKGRNVHPITLVLAVLHINTRVEEVCTLGEDSRDCFVAIITTLALLPVDAAFELYSRHTEGGNKGSVGVFDCYCRMKECPCPSCQADREEAVGDHIYGVDTAIPQKYEGQEETDSAKLVAMIEAAIPQGHRDFAAKLLSDHGVPELPADAEKVELSYSLPQAKLLVDESLTHPKCRMIVNALGTPPAEIVEQVQASGRLIGALAGRLKHGINHKNAGLDFVICQGHEGGGHTGEVTSMVLWPQMVKALAPLPVLAAGGIGSGQQIMAAMSMGAEGVWLGSMWLNSSEAEAEPAQRESYMKATSEDTVRTRSFSGKPGRVLKNEWTEAWASPDTPDPLPMPLQGYLTADAQARTHRYAGVGDTQKVGFSPVGQVVGQIHEIESCRDIMERLLTEYYESYERIQSLMPE